MWPPRARRRRLGLTLGLLILASLACRFTNDLQATETSGPGFLPLTAMAQVTPPPAPRIACPIPAGQVSPPAVESPAQFGRALLSYLNAGGQATQLTESTPGLTLSRPDLDGDGYVDLAFSLLSGGGQLQPEGAVFVYRCRQERFELVYTDLSTPERGAPQVEQVADATLDGADDLLVTQEACGAHTCFVHVQLLSWTDGTLVNRFEGATDDLPGPTVELETSTGAPANIIVTGSGYNSVGAGPYRRLERTWSWDPVSGFFRPSSERELPSDYRIHLVHDADQAAADGHLSLALELFQAAATDPSLRPWVEASVEQPTLAGYARFRQMAISLRQGAEGQAGDYLQALRDEAAGDPAAAYVGLAEAFWAVYGQTGSVDQACREAQAYAASHQATILDPLYYGYANPTYGPADICPLTGG